MAVSAQELRQLITRAKAGEADALAAVVEAHLHQIYRFARRMCPSPADAQDVAQDTLASLVTKLDTFREEAALSSWLFAIARSHCSRRHRKSTQITDSYDESTFGEGANAQPPDDALDEAVDRRLAAEHIEHALTQLPQEAREVLVLRDIEGFSAIETGQMLSLSIPAVKSRLHRARASLRRLLDKQLGQHQALEPTCTRVVDLFLQNLEEDIDANLCASMKSHVASCPQCKAECDRLHVLLAQCSDLQQVEVPRQLQDEIRQAIAKLRGSTTAKLIDATNDGN